MASDERKYLIKESWIFNLESMHDKLYCVIYDIQDSKLQLPVSICGKKIESEEDVMDLIDEAGNLEWIAKSRMVTGKEYGRIKELVTWRVEQRYATCMANGMDERDAGECFDDL